MAANIPVCFIGLGALGQPMAANLLAAGVPLTVYNRSPERQQLLQAAGALPAHFDTRARVLSAGLWTRCTPPTRA